MTSSYRAGSIPYIFLPLQRASVFISPLIGKQAGKQQRDVVTVRAAVFVRMLGQAGRKQRRDTGAYAIEQGSPHTPGRLLGLAFASAGSAGRLAGRFNARLVMRLSAEAIWLATAALDMRTGIDGLSLHAQPALG